jgi:hypothetical protein
MYDDFTAHICWFRMTKDITLRIKFTPNVNKLDQFVVTQSSMYVEGVGQKSGPCTATFNDLLCFPYWLALY